MCQFCGEPRFCDAWGHFSRTCGSRECSHLLWGMLIRRTGTVADGWPVPAGDIDFKNGFAVHNLTFSGRAAT